MGRGKERSEGLPTVGPGPGRSGAPLTRRSFPQCQRSLSPNSWGVHWGSKEKSKHGAFFPKTVTKL